MSWAGSRRLSREMGQEHSRRAGRVQRGRSRPFFENNIPQFEVAAGTSLEHLCLSLGTWAGGHGPARLQDVRLTRPCFALADVAGSSRAARERR
jgi:hypothetical protein